MPSNVVKTPAEEEAWEKAKEIVRKQYPNVKEGTPKFYRLVMGIFQRITGKRRGGHPKTEKERQETHRALFGNTSVPPRGAGLQRSKYIINKRNIKI